MTKVTRLIILALMMVYSFVTSAQLGFYIPKAGKVFFTGDSATIFSNINNKGNFGVGENAVINFSGHIWENDPQSLITDESYGGNGFTGKGGWIRFISDSIRQRIIGGYNAAIKSGPKFSNLQVQNKFGIELSGGNTKVRKEIKLSDGLVYLYDNIMVVGDNNPGKISGYDSARYFVTGKSYGGGMLLRENINSSTGQVDFPVGSRESAYTPASVRSRSQAGDDYYVNVFDSVKAHVFTGDNLSSESVNKTWAIGKSLRPNLDDVEISLQHLNADEGSFFASNKKNTYIARYTVSKWDSGRLQIYPFPGSITTGTPLENSGVNPRLFTNGVEGPSYFTKLTGSGDPTFVTKLSFNAYIIDENKVHTYWKTKPEIFVRYFIVQRMFSNENTFSDIDTVSSLALNGISFMDIDYACTDFNDYDNIIFYRLKTVGFGNTFVYSDLVAVERKQRASDNVLWPNPAKDKFRILLGGIEPVNSIVITDIGGRKVKQENVNGRNLIEMGGLMPGVYFVSLVRYDGKIIETKKLIIIDN